MDRKSQDILPALRPDYQKTRRQRGDDRPVDRIRAHYQLERRLAEHLLQSSRQERAAVYSAVYAELFTALADHPQHTTDRTGHGEQISIELDILRSFLTPRTRFLELGCGDARLSYAAAGMVQSATGLDVTDALIDFAQAPSNFHFVRTIGTNIDLASDAVDVAYSNQLMEHLHPEDAQAQLAEIVRVLRPGGLYWCRTPNRVTGPHDVSRYFDYTATGFHLREYDFRSMQRLFTQTGFRRVRFYTTVRGVKTRFPYSLAATIETLVARFPWLANLNKISHLLDLNVLGYK
ncbi:MAG: class I SAM-dependent methyltransferase [Herminiimonas sp.]|nr:class I SAM-dependent methyltransferase [Herminiimonas sp.]